MGEGLGWGKRRTELRKGEGLGRVRLGLGKGVG